MTVIHDRVQSGWWRKRDAREVSCPRLRVRVHRPPKGHLYSSSLGGPRFGTIIIISTVSALPTREGDNVSKNMRFSRRKGTRQIIIRMIVPGY